MRTTIALSLFAFLNYLVITYLMVPGIENMADGIKENPTDGWQVLVGLAQFLAAFTSMGIMLFVVLLVVFTPERPKITRQKPTRKNGNKTSKQVELEWDRAQYPR